MDVQSNIPASSQQPAPPARRRIFGWPSTRSGWWAFTLTVVFVALFIVNAFVFLPSTDQAAWRQVVLPFYGIGMLLCGLVAGILGLIAVIKKGERSILVWLTLLPGLWVLFMLLGEFLVPH